MEELLPLASQRSITPFLSQWFRHASAGISLAWFALFVLPCAFCSGGTDTKALSDAFRSLGWSPLLLVWAWTQGEPAVIVGGALAAQGYWPWYGFCLAAAIPSAIGQEIYYFIGFRYGGRVLAWFPLRWQPAIDRTRSLLVRHEGKILALMRFAYGIRGPLPAVCGAAGIRPLKFLLFNLGTAIAWASVFTLIGYAFGATATALFESISRYEAWILISSLIFGVCLQVLGQQWAKRTILKA